MTTARREILDHSLFHWLQLLATASAGGWAALALFESRYADAAVLASVAAIGTALLATPERLAALFRLAILAAAFVNGAGYVLDLWVQRTPFDELVHALTSFAGTATLAWLLLARTRLIENCERGKIVAAAVAIGAMLGVAWEVAEWLGGIIGDRRDTIVDLAMDGVGALAAGMFCAWAADLRRGGSA